MSPSKIHPIPRMVLEITAIMMMLINLSCAAISNREDLTFELFFKRAMTQAGVNNHLPSSSTSFSHAAAVGYSSTDNASAGGMHGKWPNGQDGKPKDLSAHHASQRALYERPPVIPTEPLPYNPNPRSRLSPSPSPSPSPAPSPSINPKKQNRKLIRYTDEGKPKPLKSPPASGPTGAEYSSSSPSPAPAPSTGGRSGRKLLESGKSRLRNKRGGITKRSLVTSGGSGSGGSSGTMNYSGMNAHSTSQSGLYGTWPDGSSGRPIHPNERKMFDPYVAPPKASYHIAPPGTPLFSSAPSPSPASAPSPSMSGRRLLSTNNTSKKCRLRNKC